MSYCNLPLTSCTYYNLPLTSCTYYNLPLTSCTYYNLPLISCTYCNLPLTSCVTIEVYSMNVASRLVGCSGSSDAVKGTENTFIQLKRKF